MRLWWHKLRQAVKLEIGKKSKSYYVDKIREGQRSLERMGPRAHPQGLTLGRRRNIFSIMTGEREKNKYVLKE